MGHHGVHRETTVHIQSLWEYAGTRETTGDDNPSTDFESIYEFTLNGIQWETTV
jgi:hypothetical protein